MRPQMALYTGIEMAPQMMPQLNSISGASTNETTDGTLHGTWDGTTDGSINARLPQVAVFRGTDGVNFRSRQAFLSFPLYSASLSYNSLNTCNEKLLNRNQSAVEIT